MDLSAAGVITGLVLSSIGLGLFLFGKKERRAPQLAGGVLLMLVPFLPMALWLQWLVGAVTCLGVRGAVRAGY